MTATDAAAGSGEASEPNAEEPLAAAGQAFPAPQLSGAKPLALVGLVALADFLFYGHPVGWTLGGFSAAVLVTIAACNPRLVRRPAGLLLFVLTLGLAAALVEYPSPLTIALCLAGLASFALADQERMISDALRWIEGLSIFLLQAVPRAIGDVAGLRRATIRSGVGVSSTGARSAVSAWLLPLVFGGVFTLLFSSANPIISSWLGEAFAWLPAMELPTAGRVLFWAALVVPLWSFVHPWLFPIASWQGPGWIDPALSASNRPPSALLGFLFSPAAILNSMLVFNVLFAVQNGLDAVYLWGGQALPEGFTFATYAHRSAYPLVATALIAAAFVLIAFRRESESGQGKAVRGLMYLWIGQNVLLVASAIWRTLSYVEVYSLTYLRLSALIWMGLVAAGLVLIVVRFLRGKTNRWLLNVNMAHLMAVLYALCFVDLGAFIADYNVRRCREAGGPAVNLDENYLRDIGPSALPALRWYLSHRSSDASWPGAGNLAAHFERTIQSGNATWRGWTYRWHRYAEAVAAPPVPVPALP